MDGSHVRERTDPRVRNDLQWFMPSTDIARRGFATFLRANRQAIASAAWDQLEPAAARDEQLRRDSCDLLVSVASTVESGRLEVRSAAPDAAAARHAQLQRHAGWTAKQVYAEYRALGSSAYNAWKESGAGAAAGDAEALLLFRDALDAAMAESMDRLFEGASDRTDLFIGTLAHDIRAPLGAITLCVEYLTRQQALSPVISARLLHSAGRIAGIVENVADFALSRADGDIRLHRTPCSLREPLARIVEETRSRRPAPAIVFDCDGDFRGDWDAGRVGQLVANLLGNAVQYGDPGGAVTLRVEEADGGAAVDISVHNQGPAIPAADLPRLFEPWLRGEHGVGRSANGLGLGLYICRGIAQAHGGSLRVVSTAEAGTVFTATLRRSA
jgi:signal transduction histidine kinase